eukprot:scaffold3797_cov267-Chaetoceros_neogracile.AAC.11
MKALRYPIAVTIGCFNDPNFGLVADILYWMTQRYDPNASIHDCIDSESDRVRFVKEVAIVFYEGGNIRLNSKKLFGADEHAVGELLKIAKILLEAVNDEKDRRDSGVFELKQVTESTLIAANDIKTLRSLTSQLTETGARLYSLLANEVECKERRDNVSAFIQAATLNDAESSSSLDAINDRLQFLLQGVKVELAALEEEVAHMGADRNDILTDIKRKKEDLERSNIRLQSLHSARPAFMDEFETLEIDLQKHYELYMERYRNVHYLKHELACIRRKEKAMESNRNTKLQQAKWQQDRNVDVTDRNEYEQSIEPRNNMEQSKVSQGSHDIVLDDQSLTTDESMTLLVSHSSGDRANGGNTTSSSKESFSVDSATYFMGGSDIRSEISPISKASTSSEDSDNNF